jgi:hypothetical protein
MDTNEDNVLLITDENDLRDSKDTFQQLAQKVEQYLAKTEIKKPPRFKHGFLIKPASKPVVMPSVSGMLSRAVYAPADASPSVSEPTQYDMYEIPTPSTELFQDIHLYQYLPETILVEIPVNASISYNPPPSTNSINERLQARLRPKVAPLPIMSRLGPVNDSAMFTGQPSEEIGSSSGEPQAKWPQRPATDTTGVSTQTLCFGVTWGSMRRCPTSKRPVD